MGLAFGGEAGQAAAADAAGGDRRPYSRDRLSPMRLADPVSSTLRQE